MSGNDERERLPVLKYRPDRKRVCWSGDGRNSDGFTTDLYQVNCDICIQEMIEAEIISEESDCVG